MTRLRALALLLATAGPGACGGTTPVGEAPRPESPPLEVAAFDQAAAERSLAEAEDAEAEGDLERAAEGFRAAATTWPALVEAWAGLARVAGRLGEPREQQAARFLAQRLEQYPSEALFVQREVNIALKAYLAELEASADPNPLLVDYGATVSRFWEALYRERGRFERPGLPVFNLQAREVPAAMVTGGGLLFYLGSIVSQTGDE